MNQNLSQVSSIILRKVDRNIDSFKTEFVEKTLIERQTTVGSRSLDDYIEILEKDDHEALIFSDELNNTTSQFFRDELTFSLLEHTLIPRLLSKIEGTREIRVWSAGCSKGQEPYSAAIVLDGLSQKLGKKIPYRIFATDISEAAISQAKSGVYEYEAVENIQLKYIDRYFTLKGKSYHLKDSIKKHISFSLHDLCDKETHHPIESIYGDFDLIFCCNVLIYYQPKQQREIIKKMIQALAVNGYLILGESERLLITQFDQLNHFGFNTAIFQTRARKDNET